MTKATVATVDSHRRLPVVGATMVRLHAHDGVPAVLDYLQRVVAAGRLSSARVRQAFLRVQRFKQVDRWAGC